MVTLNTSFNISKVRITLSPIFFLMNTTLFGNFGILGERFILLDVFRVVFDGFDQHIP